MRGITYVKMAIAGAVCMIGGPALIQYVQPDPDELFKKYNPELQKRSLEGREKLLQEHQEFLDKLKEYSKSDKPTEAEKAKQEKEKEALRKAKQEAERERREILEEQTKAKK